MHAGEGATAVLMLVNIFLLLICYSVIKTVREPLILLGGGAEVRSYAAAGQALVLMGFVPLYSWFASRVDRVKLLVGVTLFFVDQHRAVRAGGRGAGAVRGRGVLHLGRHLQHLAGRPVLVVRQRHLHARRPAIGCSRSIIIGMTAGAPLGSLVAGHLFGLGFTPQVILQISAVLLLATLVLYLVVNAQRDAPRRHAEAALLARRRVRAGLPQPVSAADRAADRPAQRRQHHGRVPGRAPADQTTPTRWRPPIPASTRRPTSARSIGSYQFWVNVTALLLQAFVASRLVKYLGLRGALLALPLIALGGYSIIAAGVGFAVVRWIKTAENATDYSIMNTARQLLWLPTSREEKYKAKQAIDTFFMRGGDVLSAGVVYLGAMRMGISGFAAANVALTLVWLTVALLILRQHRALARQASDPVPGR